MWYFHDGGTDTNMKLKMRTSQGITVGKLGSTVYQGPPAGVCSTGAPRSLPAGALPGAWASSPPLAQDRLVLETRADGAEGPSLDPHSGLSAPWLKLCAAR